MVKSMYIYFICILHLNSYTVLSQRDFANPAVTDPAPCSCDLRANACDPNCCCDSDCDTSDLSASPICNSVKTTASYASASQLNFQTWNCSNSTSAAIYDYFPFVCVQFELNEIFGEYHSTKNVTFLKTSDDAQNIRPTFTSEYPDLFLPATLVSTSRASYAIGAPVITGSETFKLPGNIAGSACQDDVTVLFGVNRDVSCPLSATSYSALCTTISTTQLFSSSGGISTTVNAIFHTANYNSPTILTRGYTGEFYFPNTSTISISSISKTNEPIYDYCPGRHPTSRIQRFNSFCNTSDTALCPSQYQTWSGCPVRNDLKYSTISQFFTPRSVSTYDGTNFEDFTGAVNNSLISCPNNDIRRVYYLFSYSSVTNTISSVDVYVQLSTGAASLPSTRITIQWKDTENNAAASTTIPRGYLDGEALQFLHNSQVSDVSVLVPNSNGLCVDATPQMLRYKKSTSSSCFIQLQQETIRQCHDLKLNMYLYLNTFYAPATHVLVYPNTNATSIPIRDDAQDLRDLDRIDETRSNNQLNTSYIRTSALRTSVYKIYDAAQELSICYNVPSGIYIEFGYVRVQISPTVSFERIVSVQYNYTFSNWTFDCNQGTCDSTSTKRYPVSLQSSFIDLTSSVLNLTSVTKADLTSSDNHIEHLLWLITPEYKGEPGYRKYTIAMILIFIAISVIVFHVLLFGFMCPF